MEELIKDYLFTKCILVSSDEEKCPAEVYYTLANKFGIRAYGDTNLLGKDCLLTAARMRGEDISEPFYVGFPKSVIKLSPIELILDKLIHYYNSYGMNDFSTPGHSIFEESIEREFFNEHITIRDFEVVSEADGIKKALEIANNLLASTRPLSRMDMDFIDELMLEYDYLPRVIKSKNSAIKLLVQFNNLEFLKFLNLSDTIKIVEELLEKRYLDYDLKKLNLRNKDRKFITRIINEFFTHYNNRIEDCFSKKRIWCGLLHQIHYKPINDEALEFVRLIRDRKNISYYSKFTALMDQNKPCEALDYIKSKMGTSIVLRNLNYLLSRCNSKAEIEYVLDNIESNNVVLLIQLLLSFNSTTQYRRTFKYQKFNRLITYTENDIEMAKRKSFISPKARKIVLRKIEDNLKATLKNRLGRVYIDDGFSNIAVPISEGTTNSGFGVLPRGSRIHIAKDKKIRAFTYWEKVSDIDLSAILLNRDNTQREFSWRTSHYESTPYIIFSGDQTCGYDGGSEYFDIDIKGFKKANPKGEYLIFSDNVYSNNTFNNLYCRAGFMLRDKLDSGEVYEPKTVESAFTITTESRFAHLFAIDLKSNDLIWLNIGTSSLYNIAGEMDLAYLRDYFSYTDIINLRSLFEMMATEATKNISDADVILSDRVIPEYKDKQIHSYDFDKILKLLND